MDAKDRLSIKIYTDKQVRQIMIQQQELTNHSYLAFHGFLEFATRLDECAQWARFLPDDLLIPRVQWLGNEFARAARDYKSQLLKCRALGMIQPVYIEYIMMLSSHISDGIDGAINGDKCRALKALFVKHPTNAWLAPLVENKQLGRAEGMSEWREWILNQWLLVETQNPDLHAFGIIQRLLDQLAPYEGKERQARSDLSRDERRALKSLERVQSDKAADYGYQLKRKANP